VPALQLVQPAEPKVLYKPAEQVEQTAMPVCALYLPASQPVQTEAVSLEYLPGLHEGHATVPSAPVNMPAAQAMHAFGSPAPGSVRYLPTAQATHDVLPAPSWYLPAPHCRQDAALAPPVVAEYLPASQLTQYFRPAAAV
jgi:hypothetical protein